MRRIAITLALAAVATPLRAEPSLFAFTGYTTQPQGFCVQMMQAACDRAFGQCERDGSEVYFVDRLYNVSLGCDEFPEIGAVVFGVSAAADSEAGDELRNRVLQMKQYIDSRL